MLLKSALLLYTIFSIKLISRKSQNCWQYFCDYEHTLKVKKWVFIIKIRLKFGNFFNINKKIILKLILKIEHMKTNNMDKNGILKQSHIDKHEHPENKDNLDSHKKIEKDSIKEDEYNNDKDVAKGNGNKK